ncbi:IS5 family transposase [bacterium]|nr:IS5 family transposase [bacterium]
MFQPSFFDFERRLNKIDKNGDPLYRLNQVVDWEQFRPELEAIRKKERKSKAGRKPYDVILMFKIQILQSLYNLSDDSMEMQILDRLSFMRFLGLKIGQSVPDAKTIWLFRETLTNAGIVKALFNKFDSYLHDHGFKAMKGQIVDASIVSVAKQRNSREENKQIKDGLPPENWDDNKRRQKDIDARWTKKNNKTFFGYKNHVNVDVKNKFIRDYEVTSASVHDSNVFESILDERNTSKDVWADSAYRSKDKLDFLKEQSYRGHLQRKGCRNKKLTEWEKQGNHTRSKIRSRVEHIFGAQTQKAGNLILRSIGSARASVKIGLRNLAYNMDRYRILATS